MTENSHHKTITETLKREALTMAVNCVRNTVIEDYHAGIVPQSKTGDYSDVKVVTPYGEIAWNELSRISDSEMKVFNKEVADKLYTYLEFLLNPKYEDKQQAFLKVCNIFYPHNWDEPKLDKGLMGIKKEE